MNICLVTDLKSVASVVPGGHSPAVRKGVISALVFSIALLFPGPAAADDQQARILKGLVDRYGGLPGLEVPYEREIITKSMALLGEAADRDLASGRIYFKPAHNLRIEQEEPRPETVVSDGDTLWWYLPRKKQAYRYPSRKLGQEIRLLGDIFQGLKAVEERFDVRVEEEGAEENHRLRLTPNPAWEQLDHINLFVTHGDFRIRVVEIYNILGSVTRFTLGEISVREAFAEGFFRFVPPKDVRVIEEE